MDPVISKVPILASFQYLCNIVKDEVDFLPVDIHQRFFKIDTIILCVCDQACPNYAK